MSGWQPIETAPRDGTELLLYSLDVVRYPGAGDGVVVGWAVRVLGGHRWVCDIATTDGYDDDMWLSNEEITPTHWMPLPAPPKPD